jgi:acyl phosphate:glycerol-3-phosphate acyltransferase
MPIISYSLIACAGYLLGSIPFGYLLVRIFRKEDIRNTGSGNIGATNVIRSGAKGLGLLTFLLDACKGYAAVAVLAWLLPHTSLPPVLPQNARAIAAAAAILGHIFPVWLGFKGGKGVATALGAFLALVPYAALAGAGVFAVVVLVSRYVSLASVLAAAAFPFFALRFAPIRTPLFTAVLFLIPLLVIAKHRQNIWRLLHGSEYRFGKPKASAA